MTEAYVVDAMRTPIGAYRGVLSGVRPDDLAAHVIAPSSSATALDPERIVDVYFGAANQSGEDNRDVARMAVLLAGLPHSVPGATVNRLCASGLEAVNSAARAVKLGEGDLYLAGGVESMSRAPWVVEKPERGLPRGPQTMHDTTLGWRMINPRMAELGVSTESMGETGENVAERYGISREDQDAFALRSHRRAVAAAEAGLLRRGDRPDRGAAGPRETVIVDADEGPRPDASLEKLAALRPVFREGGTVTAGNASTLNDGAACLADRLRGGAPSGSAPSRWPGSSPSASPASTPPTWASARSRRSRAALADAGLSLDADRPDRDQRGLRLAGPRLRRGSSGSTRRGSTSTAARSPSATRSAAPAPASARPWSASCAAAAGATASPPSASASARAWRRSSSAQSAAYSASPPR